MKTQILIEDGAAQIVLTPETDFEKAALNGLQNGEMFMAVKRGEFAMCQGGYYREFDHRPHTQSVMLVAKNKAAAE